MTSYREPSICDPIILDDSVSERAKAEEYYERLTTFESPDLAKWTASCIKGQGSTQGRGDFVRICESKPHSF